MALEEAAVDHGNLLVGDVSNNMIFRARLETEGLSLLAQRADPDAEDGGVRVGDDLWVESAMNSVELGRVEDDLVRARARVAGIFGEVRAHPTVIVVRDVAGIDRYCANDTGAAYNSPFGSFVVLGPHGYASVDVIAHELVHALLLGF